MKNWTKSYEEIRRRKLANITEKEFNAEMELAAMEERLMPQTPKESCVVSSGSFWSDSGDYDRKGITPRV